MAKLQLEVADIFRHQGGAYREAHGLGRAQARAMGAISSCRTAALGGHVERCDECEHIRVTYNSCRNRHCPKCQSLARAQWLEARQAELLDTQYFHVVFTIPEQIAGIALQNPDVVYGILFAATQQTLREIAGDPRHLGAEIGFIAILHTWGQNLQFHPHLHCVVPGGGLAPEGDRWISCRKGFFLPVRVLSRRFRTLFVGQLQQAFEQGRLTFNGKLQALREPKSFARHLEPARKVEWVVYAKPPFGGPQQVLDYLGRYTHRVAISNNRLLRFEEGQVSFRWKDYRCGNKRKVMTLSANEFIRRFLLHTLPDGFHKIRHYGFLSNRQRAAKLTRCRELIATAHGVPAPRPMLKQEDLNYRDRYERLTGRSLIVCPACGQGHMQAVETFRRGAPPCLSRLDSS